MRAYIHNGCCRTLRDEMYDTHARTHARLLLCWMAFTHACVLVVTSGTLILVLQQDTIRRVRAYKEPGYVSSTDT